jgi:putative endonuclease
MSEKNYTYILRCGDGSLYTGWTNHIRKRLADHQNGRGAKYTRSHQPVELVYLEVYATREEAMHREAVIKKLNRMKKLALIAEHPGWRTLMPPAETERSGEGA